MPPRDLTDAEWRQIADLFPSSAGDGSCRRDRQVLNGILWALRTGNDWHRMPPRYGAWQTIYACYRRWTDSGRLGCICRRLSIEVSPLARRRRSGPRPRLTVPSRLLPAPRDESPGHHP